LLGVDQIAVELENPFAVSHLSHLPLDGISATIEEDVLALLDGGGPAPAPR
jgi:predicted membrane chloride channel (bestrophin family)